MYIYSHLSCRLRFSFVRPRISLSGTCQGNCARLARVHHLPYFCGSLRLTLVMTPRCFAAHALPWPALGKSNATIFAREFSRFFILPLAISCLRPSFNVWNLLATWGEVLWDHGSCCFLRILPSTMALSHLGSSLRSTLSLTPCGLRCRSLGLPCVEFSCFNVVSNSFLHLISWLFNSVHFLILCEFSPCVQGSVPGFALVFNIPTQVCPLMSTIQLLIIMLQLLDLTSTVHSSILDCAFSVWPLCPIIVGVYPCAPNNSYSYATTDTMLLLPSGNLLVAILVGRHHFCINYECGGVSCLRLIFQGTRKFSVQQHPLPSR